jgi:hypothetical protein
MKVFLVAITLFLAFSYEETLTLLPIGSSNTLHIFNFSDSIKIPEGPVKNFAFFPVFISQMLEVTQEFSVDLAWGTGESIQDYLTEYQHYTNRTISVAQPGLSGSFQGKNWEKFKALLSGGLTVSFLKNSLPIHFQKFSYFYEQQFLCEENLLKIIDWLPCRDSGLTALFDQLLTSSYLNIQISAKSAFGNYSYFITISALRKSKITGPTQSCILTTQEIFENSMLEKVSNLNMIKLSAKKPSIKQLFRQKRWLIDEEHGFNSLFFHEFFNDSPVQIEIEWCEYFPSSTTPLLSSIEIPVHRVTRNSYGWLLQFKKKMNPGVFLLKIKLEKQLQGFEDYPNDPQRGWDIVPSPVFMNSDLFFSNGLLIMIPEPDFSMPFNVICITGSVIAFFFTSFQNLQTWKDSVHWSDSKYESTILKAKKTFNILKNVILVVSLAVMFYLDQKGIIKMFG